MSDPSAQPIVDDLTPSAHMEPSIGGTMADTESISDVLPENPPISMQLSLKKRRASTVRSEKDAALAEENRSIFSSSEM